MHARSRTAPPTILMWRRTDSARIAHRVAAAAFAASLAGCLPNVPETVKPALDMPASWETLPLDGRGVTVDRWWTVYGDPVLERLVDEALERSSDIALAVARVDEARALLAQAEAQLRLVAARAAGPALPVGLRQHVEAPEGHDRERRRVGAERDPPPARPRRGSLQRSLPSREDSTRSRDRGTESRSYSMVRP